MGAKHRKHHKGRTRKRNLLDCPVCTAGKMQPSRRRGARDFIAKLCGFRPFRCDRCLYREYRFRG